MNPAGAGALVLVAGGVSLPAYAILAHAFGWQAALALTPPTVSIVVLLFALLTLRKPTPMSPLAAFLAYLIAFAAAVLLVGFGIKLVALAFDRKA
jgi:hypothetical protein